MFDSNLLVNALFIKQTYYAVSELSRIILRGTNFTTTIHESWIKMNAIMNVIPLFDMADA